MGYCSHSTTVESSGAVQGEPWGAEPGCDPLGFFSDNDRACSQQGLYFQFENCTLCLEKACSECWCVAAYLAGSTLGSTRYDALAPIWLGFVLVRCHRQRCQKGALAAGGRLNHSPLILDWHPSFTKRIRFEQISLSFFSLKNILTINLSSPFLVFVKSN